MSAPRTWRARARVVRVLDLRARVLQRRVEPSVSLRRVWQAMRGDATELMLRYIARANPNREHLVARYD
eukprot:4706389-Lingulodinium_polyedra.AAC.1